MPVFNNAFNSKWKLQNSIIYFSYVYMYFVFSRSVEMLYKMNSIVFISLLDTGCILPMLFSLLMSKEELKEKGIMGFFPSVHIIFSSLSNREATVYERI